LAATVTSFALVSRPTGTTIKNGEDMFSLQGARPASLTSVDDSLTFNSSDLSADWVAAASETHLYVQTVAKAIAQQKGLDIGDPNLYGQQGWYDALTAALATYADWVEIVGEKDVQVNNSTHSGSINLSAIMGTIMSLYLGPTAAAEWSTLNELLGKASDPGVSDFMNFWWSHVKKSTKNTGMSVGPNVKTTDSQIQWAICYYSMTHIIDDWRTMFVASKYEEFDVSAVGLTLTMDYDNYVRYAQSAVQTYLGNDIGTKILTAPVPKAVLGGAPVQRSLSSVILNAPRPVSDSPLGAESKDLRKVRVDNPRDNSTLVSDVTGVLTENDGVLTELRVDGFRPAAVPVVGQQYVISGQDKGTGTSFKLTLKCRSAGPESYFVRP
jgi:hypothetical protein